MPCGGHNEIDPRLAMQSYDPNFHVDPNNAELRYHELSDALQEDRLGRMHRPQFDPEVDLPGRKRMADLDFDVQGNDAESTNYQPRHDQWGSGMTNMDAERLHMERLKSRIRKGIVPPLEALQPDPEWLEDLPF